MKNRSSKRTQRVTSPASRITVTGIRGGTGRQAPHKWRRSPRFSAFRSARFSDWSRPAHYECIASGARFASRIQTSPYSLRRLTASRDGALSHPES